MRASRGWIGVLVGAALALAGCAEDKVECSSAAACDDGDPCTTDACVSGACARSFSAAPCDDGDVCTVGDVCGGGVCAGAAKDCSGVSGACAVGACDAATGACVAEAAHEGERCDDGSACTVGELCAGGLCRGTPKDCAAFGNACNTGFCNTGTGACQARPANEGQSCEDGDLCTEGDACSLGRCVGAAKDCTGLDGSCAVGTCSRTTGECAARARNEGGACEDGDLCTEGDRCALGVCLGSAKDCAGLDGACTVGVCAAGSGACVAEPTREGEACDDGVLCTQEDACVAGVCAGRSTFALLQSGAGLAGWSVERAGPEEGPQVQTSGGVEITTRPPGEEAALRVVWSQEVPVFEGEGRSLVWVIRVEQAPPGLGAAAALVVLPAAAGSAGLLSEAKQGQAVVLEEGLVRWGDSAQVAMLDTTDAEHTYRLDVSGSGDAVLSVDREVVLERSGVVLDGAVGFGDLSDAPSEWSVFVLSYFDRVCYGY